jgi:hypothetical protein
MPYFDLVVFFAVTVFAYSKVSSKKLLMFTSLTFWVSQLAYYQGFHALDVFLTILFNVLVVLIAQKQIKLDSLTVI